MGTNVGLIAGLAVVIIAVCASGFKILQKRNQDYWDEDLDEGGEEDFFKRFIDDEKL